MTDLDTTALEDFAVTSGTRAASMEDAEDVREKKRFQNFAKNCRHRCRTRQSPKKVLGSIVCSVLLALVAAT